MQDYLPPRFPFSTIDTIRHRSPLFATVRHYSRLSGIRYSGFPDTPLYPWVCENLTCFATVLPWQSWAKVSWWRDSLNHRSAMHTWVLFQKTDLNTCLHYDQMLSGNKLSKINSHYGPSRFIVHIHVDCALKQETKIYFLFSVAFQRDLIMIKRSWDTRTFKSTSFVPFLLHKIWNPQAFKQNENPLKNHLWWE